MSSIFKKFCAPAIIYLVFSMVHTLVAVGRNDNSGALLQLSLGILVTLLLQLLCMKGMNIISWIIVFLPFMFYTYIVIILYKVFGITVVYPEVYDYDTKEVEETDNTQTTDVAAEDAATEAEDAATTTTVATASEDAATTTTVATASEDAATTNTNVQNSETTTTYSPSSYTQSSETQNNVISYGDQVVIAYTDSTNNTSNCGWYGCRVAYLNSTDQIMKFGHGSSNQSASKGFYLRPPSDSTKSNGDNISYGDKVVIVYTDDPGETSNCGLYGCSVAYMNATDKIMKFLPGSTIQDSDKEFYLRPPSDSTKTTGENISYDDQLVIAKTSSSNNTSNCGWYGCRVAYMTLDDKIMRFGHGSTNESASRGFYFRKPNST